jgi:hypothetical protein
MSIERMYVAGKAGEPQIGVRTINVLAGAGIEGDRPSSAEVAPAAVVSRFVHRAGIRADVLGSGSITVGDRVRAAD